MPAPSPASASSESRERTLRDLARELLSEVACLALVYLPMVLAGRGTVLYLHSQGERAEAVPLAGFFSPSFWGYYIEDILSFFCLASLCLALGLWISRRILLRQALIAGLLFLALVIYVAGVNYYATYEVQFGWNHILKWEGTDEMLTSIRAETPWLAIYAILGGGLLLAGWAVWSARLLQRMRAQTLSGVGGPTGTDDASPSEQNARALAALPVWPGGVRLLALSLVIAPAPFASLPYQAGVAEPAAAGLLSFEAANRHEIQRTLGTNVLSQLVFTMGRAKSDQYDLITPDGQRFVSRRPFRFRFETESLEWLAANPGFQSQSGAGPAQANNGAAVGQGRQPAGIIAPIDFPRRGKKYNVVLYFFESTAAQYLEETVEAYPEIAPRTIEEMLAELEGTDSASGGQIIAGKDPDAGEQSVSDEDDEPGAETVDGGDGGEAGEASSESGASGQDPALSETEGAEDQREDEEPSVVPNWQRLAENSLVALKHYVQAPLSINSLFTIMTSAYALPADRWAATDYPDIPLISLPEILKQNGYSTGIFHTGTYHYAGQGDFLKHRSFDVMHDAKQLRVPPFTEELNWGIDDRALIEPSVNFARSSRRQGKPFFLVAMPVSPHHPYDVPEPAFELYDIDPETDGFPDRWKRAFAKYKNALYYSDYVLGEYIKAFEEAGLADDTIFIVFADHGEAFGQHRGNYNHPFFVYEENVHVPFLIYNPRLFPKSIEYNHVTRHTDILPTVLDMLGLSAFQDERHEGRSLLAGGPPQLATFYTSWRNRLAGVRDENYKYIYNLETGREELYDLRRDPGEYRHVADDALIDRYRNYVFELIVYQRKYFEKVLDRAIDWSATQEKDEGPVVRENPPASTGGENDGDTAPEAAPGAQATQ
ncbi:MAG: sulfatase-like hydrolase/transferase [bacterium]|nr:sulfatase-like hydrolase/transferase [bacterium]